MKAGNVQGLLFGAASLVLFCAAMWLLFKPGRKR